ncbi:MAG: hypothetical protein JWQ18_2795 [Conexibacter sp.]|nr:hypothetical protein [Conexibacter sp.]
MLRSRTTLALVAAGSAIALAAPAAQAAAPPTGITPGHVLEFGRLTTISGSAGNDGSTFTKKFESARRSHVVFEDGGSGALRSEYTTAPRSWKTFDATANTLTLRDGTAPFEQTPAQEAAYFQQGIDDGCFVKTGSADGLDHYKMVASPQPPCSDSPDTKVDADLDQRTGYVISRITTNETFRQSDSLAYVKDHAEAGRAKLLRLAPHPGAQVIDER